METITVTQKHQTKAKILTSLLEGGLTIEEAASALGLSVRQVERLRPAYRRAGIAALVHGNTGKKPWNAVSQKVRDRALQLVEFKYVGFNHQHTVDMFGSVERFFMSRHTLRRICLADGKRTPRPQKRRSRHRSRRDRREQEGQMLQMDGSPHDWLEGRGPKLMLINGVDDATGTKWARFREGEDLEGYVEVFLNVVEAKGLPDAIYTDETGITAGASTRFKNSPVIPKLSQFSRMLKDVGVAVILANSAQAKGRVERTHGTDQDRLVSLLRLAGASTLEEANVVLQYHLDDFNARFTVPAKNPTPAWRTAPSRRELNEIFSMQEQRKVANDNTVRVYGRIIDIPPGPGRRSYAGATVTVHRRFDRTVGVFYQGARIGGDRSQPRAPIKRGSPPDWLKPHQLHRQNR